MAAIPLLLNLAEDLADPLGWDRDFGFGVSPKEIYQIYHRPVHRLKMLSRNRRSPYSLKKPEKAKLETHVGKDGFQVSMDVEQFQPNEITVKTVDNTIVVEAKHEEREDEFGVISRHFVRKCTLPKGYDPKEVVSTLSSDGILTVKAPLPPEKKAKAKERIIHIQQTGPACESIRDNCSNDQSEPVQNGTTENDSNN